MKGVRPGSIEMSLGAASQCWGQNQQPSRTISTNAPSMGSNQEELEAMVQQKRYNVVAILLPRERKIIILSASSASFIF